MERTKTSIVNAVGHKPASLFGLPCFGLCLQHDGMSMQVREFHPKNEDFSFLSCTYFFFANMVCTMMMAGSSPEARPDTKRGGAGLFLACHSSPAKTPSDDLEGGNDSSLQVLVARKCDPLLQACSDSRKVINKCQSLMLNMPHGKDHTVCSYVDLICRN